MWSFVDWSDGFSWGVPPQTSHGDSALLSLQFIEALRYAAQMEDQLSDRAMAVKNRKDAQEISVAIRQLCSDAQKRLLADTPEKKQYQ